MTRPVRLQLSRANGFRLQEMSLAVNGLPAVKVTQPGPWGNPFIVTDKIAPGKRVAGPFHIAVPTVEDAVECFRLMLHDPARADQLAAVEQLRGKNLACFCKLGSPCHADVLLELANADGGEQ